MGKGRNKVILEVNSPFQKTGSVIKRIHTKIQHKFKYLVTVSYAIKHYPLSNCPKYIYVDTEQKGKQTGQIAVGCLV